MVALGCHVLTSSHNAGSVHSVLSAQPIVSLPAILKSLRPLEWRVPVLSVFKFKCSFIEQKRTGQSCENARLSVEMKPFG